jgi:DNA-directed RNA polymerase subunit RPC12/RpoP
MNFVVIQVFSNLYDANIMMGRLQEEGINCGLKMKITVTGRSDSYKCNWWNKVDGDRLTGRKSFCAFERYRSKIEAVIKCPRCGSGNVEYVTTPRKASNWLGPSSDFCLRATALSADKVYHCFECGFEFEEMKSERRMPHFPL